ncbi:ABC transporter permease protein, partial [human gut metagenome]
TVEITSIQNSQTINLVVPEQSDKLDEFIGLRNRKHKKETYTLDDDSVIISEKIASLLKIKVGDTITIKNTDDIEKDVKVGAITENYIYHYMYMSSNLYNKLYGENSFKPNTLLIKEAEGTTEDDEDNIGKIILQDDTTVAGVSFLSGTKDIFATVMEQMQLVVYVLIISAGLLAFAVLYNLSNVNHK